MSSWSIGFGHAGDDSTTTMYRAQNYSTSDTPVGKIGMSNSRQMRKQNMANNFETEMKNGDDFDFERMESRKAEFCTKDNLLNSIAYVNQELDVLGLPCLKFENGKCVADIYFFINRLHDLLVLYRKTNAVKEDLETKHHKVSCESNHHQATCTRLRRDQVQLEKDLAQENEKTRQVTLKCKQLSNKLKIEREEVKRLTAVLQSRDVQHRHDNKKKEREIISLKERLHQLLADKVPDRKVGMDLMNVISSGEGRRATWKTGKGKQEEEMYQLVITGYEERHGELMLENSALRDCLMSIQRELSTVLKRAGSMGVSQTKEFLSPKDPSESVNSTLEDSSSHSGLSISDMDEGYIQMPFDIVRKEIEKSFKATCDQISEGMKRCLRQSSNKGSPSISKPTPMRSPSLDPTDNQRKSPSSTDNKAEVDRLRKQINNYKDIIQQQEELIQQSLHSHSQSVETTFLHESQLLKERENLSEQKKLFFEEKSAFDKERQALADAAVRLGKERQALQEERSSLLKQHIQHLGHMKENQKPQSKGDGQHASRQLPATPAFSSNSSTKGSRTNSPAKQVSVPQEMQQTSATKSPKDSTNTNKTPPGSAQVLHPGAAIHFTPCNSPRKPVKSLSPLSSGASVLPLSLCNTSTTTQSSNLNVAARLEAIQASLLRIKKSAAENET